MNMDREMYLCPTWGMSKESLNLNAPSLTTNALMSFLSQINLESRYIQVIKQVNEDVCLRRFFGIPEESDSFVSFMFDLSLSHEIVKIDKDHDPCGERNLLLVARESVANPNIDGNFIDAIIQKFQDTKGIV